MKAPCAKCGAVYDITSYQPGQRLRCRCGQIMVKPLDAPATHAARVFHCAACGGTLERGREDCPYCRAPIDMTQTRLTSYCTACLAMSKEGAKFCSECGKTLATTVDTPTVASEPCPRCAVSMRRRSVGGHRPLECPMCCGLFVDTPDLEKMIAAQEERTATESGGSPQRATVALERVAYLPCPVCKRLMNRINYGRVSGVVIDWCGDHGYWLDAGELERIAKWVATGGLEQKYRHEIERLEAERDRLSTPVRSSREAEGSSSSMVVGGLLGFLVGLFD